MNHICSSDNMMNRLCKHRSQLRSVCSIRICPSPMWSTSSILTFSSTFDHRDQHKSISSSSPFCDPTMPMHYQHLEAHRHRGAQKLLTFVMWSWFELCTSTSMRAASTRCRSPLLKSNSSWHRRLTDLPHTISGNRFEIRCHLLSLVVKFNKCIVTKRARCTNATQTQRNLYQSFEVLLKSF